jgi:hypothetical protein
MSLILINMKKMAHLFVRRDQNGKGLIMSFIGPEINFFVVFV